MPPGRTAAVAAAVTALVAGCGNAAPPPERSPAPDSPPADVVRVVNLNAGMGFRNSPGDPGGTDATEEDIGFLAGDILGQRGDVANLQEMALPAAERLRAVLGTRTGDEWQLNWAYTVHATYYPGRAAGEGPGPGYEDVPAGNAQLVRIGDGIRAQEPITVDGENDDQGIVLGGGGRSVVGAAITTAHGVVDVYTTHLPLAERLPDGERAADVRTIQGMAEARDHPVVLTGDLNQTIDLPPGGAHTNPLAVAAVRAFTQEYGYTDVARDQGPTSDEKRPDMVPKRIDYIFARDVRTTGTVRFVSHESDHWGLATTIERVTR
jgi:endonuclease/exonuclease/phosphatase family metal-dependent hydrolase